MIDSSQNLRSSVTRERLIRGNIASVSGMALSVLFQVAATPVYLSTWDSETYGLWLVFIAFTGALVLVDHAHQAYIGNEFLRVGLDDEGELERIAFSSIIITVITAGLVMLIVIILSFTGVFEIFSKDSKSSSYHLSILLCAHSAAWLVSGSVGGILVRLMNVFGEFSRFTWWGTLIQTGTVLAPVIAALNGIGLLGAGLSMLVVNICLSWLMLGDALRILTRRGFQFQYPDWRLGWRNFLYSQMLSLKNLLELIKQQGMRILLLPLIGASQLTVFATIRMGANLALRALSTITSPLLPELMRFLNQRDQKRMELGLATVWFITLLVLAPLLVILLVFIEPVFLIWTRGKVEFDPILFTLFSVGIVAYAISQPAVAVVVGNNLLKAQLSIALLSVAFVLGLLAVLISGFGLRGVGLAICTGEVVAGGAYVLAAANWLKHNGLSWPWGTFRYTLTGIILTCTIFALILVAGEHRLLVAITGLVGLIINGILFFKSLPEEAAGHLCMACKAFIPSLH